MTTPTPAPTHGQAKCPRCDELVLIEIDPVLKKWICLVCSAQWPFTVN
jgi:hypothetical protein